MLWDSASKTEYPAVQVFMQRIKQAVMAVHNSILEVRIKQTRDTNRKQIPVPFSKGDLVYISIKNITFPKGLAQKLVPKYIGPYQILKDFKNSSFRIDIPAILSKCGVHNVFHVSYLCVHHPNNDKLFPGRAKNQVAPFKDFQGKWAVDKILTHSGKGQNLMFKVQ